MAEQRPVPINLLLVEDSPDDAELVVMELRRGGYDPSFRRVDTAGQMREALQERRWDMILCDYTMPDFTVSAALDVIREHGLDIPFVITSATIVDEAAVAAIKRGASDIVMKQNLAGLLPVVQRELRDSELRSLGQNVVHELEKRERQFRNLIEKSSDAIALLDANAEILYASPSTERVLGYSPEEFAGKKGLELLHPEDRETIRARLVEMARKPGQSTNAQVRVCHKNGSWRWIEAVATNLLDDPDVGAIVANYRDITERKEFEKQLQESEARYALLAEAVPSVLFTDLPDGSADYISPRFHKFTGLPESGAAAYAWLDVVHPNDVERTKHEWVHAISQGRAFDVEFRVRRADGQYRWFFSRSIPMRDASGKIIRWFGAATDIDDRKRAEEKLRASEEKFRALIENSSDGFALVDGNGVVAYLGRPVLGHVTNEMLGVRLTDLVHPDDREALGEKLQEVIHNPGREITAQYRTRHKDGSWRWVEGAAKNLLDNPSVQAIVVNYRDITERRRMEEQLLQTQKLESLGLLAGGIAHDFNNLLTGIMGNASMVLEALPRDNPNRSALLDVVNASSRAADLTHQMLAFAGKGRFVTQSIDLSELVREISHLIERAVPKNVHIRLKLDGNLPAIEVDPSQMQQLIMNLVINGAEAIGENQNGTVIVITGAQEIDTHYLESLSTKGELKPGNYVFLEVVDTGQGMDEETKAKIFDPFFTTKFLGRGLGLAATLGIVRGHNGSIKVYSHPGQGTTFKIFIPAAAEKAKKKAPESQKDLRGFGAVLVVDDEEIVRKTAKTALERYGYEVISAENGPVAIDLFHAYGEQVSLVLLDMTMPLMSGEEVFKRLKAISPEVPIIVSSGYNEMEAIRRFTGRGIAGFIQKPYTAAQLAEKIKGVLEQRKSATPPV